MGRSWLLVTALPILHRILIRVHQKHQQCDIELEAQRNWQQCCSWRADLTWSRGGRPIASGADSMGGGTCPHFYKWLGTGGHPEKNSKQETDQTVLTITKALTKTTKCTSRAKKVEGTTKFFSQCFVPDRCPTRPPAHFCAVLVPPTFKLVPAPVPIDNGEAVFCTRCSGRWLTTEDRSWWSCSSRDEWGSTPTRVAASHRGRRSISAVSVDKDDRNMCWPVCSRVSSLSSSTYYILFSAFNVLYAVFVLRQGYCNKNICSTEWP